MVVVVVVVAVGKKRIGGGKSVVAGKRIVGSDPDELDSMIQGQNMGEWSVSGITYVR